MENGTKGRTKQHKLPALERRGDKNLAKPDHATRGRVGVRIYYVSAGGETLCFDAGPMGPDGAWSLASQHRPVSNFMGGEMSRTDALDAEVIAWSEREQRAPRHGARRVVLPSQGVDTATAEEAKEAA